MSKRDQRANRTFRDMLGGARIQLVRTDAKAAEAAYEREVHQRQLKMRDEREQARREYRAAKEKQAEGLKAAEAAAKATPQNAVKEEVTAGTPAERAKIRADLKQKASEEHDRRSAAMDRMHQDGLRENARDSRFRGRPMTVGEATAYAFGGRTLPDSADRSASGGDEYNRDEKGRFAPK